jgi:hypothetical protein
MSDVRPQGCGRQSHLNRLTGTVHRAGEPACRSGHNRLSDPITYPARRGWPSRPGVIGQSGRTGPVTGMSGAGDHSIRWNTTDFGCAPPEPVTVPDPMVTMPDGSVMVPDRGVTVRQPVATASSERQGIPRP